MNESTVSHPRRGVFFTSDLHLHHDLVAKERGFPGYESHDAHVLDVWNKVVHRDAQVWVLGDLTAGGNLDYALMLLRSLPGEKHLVLGNHDPAHPMYRDSHRKQAEYYRAFASVQLHARRKINGRSVLLSHFPYTGDHTGEDRHVQWRLRNLGEPLLHGHTHSRQISLNHDGVVHVGWDAWFRPVHLDEVAELI